MHGVFALKRENMSEDYPASTGDLKGDLECSLAGKTVKKRRLFSPTYCIVAKRGSIAQRYSQTG